MTLILIPSNLYFILKTENWQIQTEMSVKLVNNNNKTVKETIITWKQI